MTDGAGFLFWLVVIPAVLLLTAYFIYAPATDVWSRFFDRTVVRQGRPGEARISLTFDDGPDPAYTPRFLAELANRDVQAAFFLVGAKAERYPDIVSQIKDGRHLIGSHTYGHRHAYLLTPGRSRREVAGGLTAVAGKTGRSAWFRPPWGAFNLATRSAVHRTGQRVALWSVTGDDWKKNRTADDIFSTVVRRLKPGAVIVLHDSGGAAGAAERTLAALPRIIDWARDNEYQWVRLDQLVDDLAGAEIVEP